MSRIPPTGSWPDVLPIADIALAWEAAGGRTQSVVPATAVCLAESSGNRHAVSSAGALGLWQIMPFNFPSTGLTQSTWTDPVANANAAVILSSGGYNWAPWDSAYTDIYTSGRLSWLPWPQPLSPADTFITQVENVLGVTGVPRGVFIPPDPVTKSDQQQAQLVMDHVTHLSSHLLPEFSQWSDVFRSKFR